MEAYSIQKNKAIILATILAAIFEFCLKLNSTASIRGRPAIVVPVSTLSWVRNTTKEFTTQKKYK